MRKTIAAIAGVLALLLFASGAGLFTAAGVTAKDAVRQEDEIRSMCMQDKRVKDAVALIFGNTCAVSLRCETVYFTNELNAVKSFVHREVRAKYPNIEKLYVRCDMDLFMKTKRIDERLKKGESVLAMKGDILEVLRLAGSRE